MSAAIKNKYLQELRARLVLQVQPIKQRSLAHQEKAQLVNSLVNAAVEEIQTEAFQSLSLAEKQTHLLILRYCASVVALEYRHNVWPYEYMALSRRVGELWERFCSAAWEYPSKQDVRVLDAPDFAEVRRALRDRLHSQLAGIPSEKEVVAALDTLFELIGEINMNEDKVFLRGDVPHVIDFKSGFGSNEKGNMLRLMTVGKAYRLWNPSARLMLVVRQNENNNYLNVIRRSRLWEVHCGDDAYKLIDELTGSSILELRRSVIDFQTDLPAAVLSDLRGQLSDLSAYLAW